MQGFLAFYKGFLPNFGRLGSWNVIMFLIFEIVSDSISSPLHFLLVEKNDGFLSQ